MTDAKKNEMCEIEPEKVTVGSKTGELDPFKEHEDDYEPWLVDAIQAECDRADTHLQYQRRLRNLSRCKVADMWETLQDLIGPLSLWPDNMAEPFWKEPRYRARLQLCCFCAINATNPELLLDWFRIRGQLTPSRERHFKSIIKDLDEGKGGNWWSFCIEANRCVYMDGRPYAPPKKKDSF